jgi:hypothetical protein
MTEQADVMVRVCAYVQKLPYSNFGENNDGFLVVFQLHSEELYEVLSNFQEESPSKHITSDLLSRRIPSSGMLRRVAATCSRWFLARGFLYPEDRGDTFLRNVVSHEVYTAPHPKRRLS